jgi:serine/threonine protein kinase
LVVVVGAADFRLPRHRHPPVADRPVHGLIFFYIQKFADLLATGTSTRASLRATVVNSTAHHLPSGRYGDGAAVSLLPTMAESSGSSVAVSVIFDDPLPDPVPEPIPEPIPERIGGYEVLGLAGSGAMGRVYLAHDAQLGRRVAVKVMNPAKARDAVARRRFIRESRAAAAVEHPHVMTIHQVGEDRGLPFIVMQYLQGRTLAAVQHAGERLSLGDVLRIGREIAEGLAAAHACGLVHRDIKPANIFLAGRGQSVRIIDFGLARDIGTESSQVTVDGAIVGTPAYMPPERIGSEDLDTRSDLFGLGVILYELLAGRLPFEGPTMVAMLAAISRGQPLPLAEAAPQVPAAVTSLVMRLIAHDKADRPADALAVAAEIAALERTLPSA